MLDSGGSFFMTGKQDFDPREASLGGREEPAESRMGQEHAMALYQSAYDFNDSGRTDCFPKDFPNRFPHPLPEGGGDIEITRCFPLPEKGFPRPDWVEPSESQQNRAETKLDSNVSALIPDADQQNLKDANHALLAGDSTALSGIYAKYKDDPAMLQAFVDEQNRELKNANADVGVQLRDGQIFVSKDKGANAVSIDVESGDASVYKVMHGSNGDIYVGSQQEDGDPSKTLDRIGNHAINEINAPERNFDWRLPHLRMKGAQTRDLLFRADDAPSMQTLEYRDESLEDSLNEEPPAINGNPQIVTV